MNINFKVLFAIMLFLFPVLTFSQSERKPDNGANGIPGQYTKSFVISWSKVPGAIKYEYVLTTNANCFAGCAGDTRQKIVQDTSAMEFALQENTWYYWIVRYYTSATDDPIWSSIYSFLAKSESEDESVKIYPNPAISENLNILVDWTTDPSLREFIIEITDPYGSIVKPANTYVKSGSAFKFELFYFNISGLPSGIYLVNLLLTSDSNTTSSGLTRRVTKKLIIP